MSRSVKFFMLSGISFIAALFFMSLSSSDYSGLLFVSKYMFEVLFVLALTIIFFFLGLLNLFIKK